MEWSSVGSADKQLKTIQWTQMLRLNYFMKMEMLFLKQGEHRRKSIKSKMKQGLTFKVGAALEEGQVEQLRMRLI